MRRSLGEQLKRYPATLAVALARPARLQAGGVARCAPVPFAVVSALLGLALSALLADDDVYRLYEWGPGLAPLMRPASQIPGITFLFTAALAGFGLASAAALGWLTLRLLGVAVPGRDYAAAFLYFAGGPMAAVVTLVQSIGLPLTFGAVFVFPEWLRITLPVALALYLVAWLARQLALLPGVGWWRGAAAAGAAALLYAFAPPDPVRVMGLESYAMTVDSMAPQIDSGSVAIANGAVFDWRAPAPGDLVVFKKTVGGAEVAVLRRVVGLSGDTVELHDGQLAVNGVAAARAAGEAGGWAPPAGVGARVFRETLPSGASYDVVKLAGGGPHDELAPVAVPVAHVYVLADNRDVAIDSRQFGPVAISELRGVVYYQLKPERRALR